MDIHGVCKATFTSLDHISRECLVFAPPPPGLVVLNRRVPFGDQTGTAHVVDDQVPFVNGDGRNLREKMWIKSW